MPVRLVHKRATVWGTLTRTCGWTCHRGMELPEIPHLQGTWQPRQGVQQLIWGPSDILIRRGLYQSAMTTMMLYNNHQISMHATGSIYLTHVFGDHCELVAYRLILVGVVLVLLRVSLILLGAAGQLGNVHLMDIQGNARVTALVHSPFKSLLVSNLIKCLWSKQSDMAKPESTEEKYSTHRKRISVKVTWQENVDV